MATQRQTLTAEPTDLVDALSLTEGTTYAIQATVGPLHGTARLAEVATKPTVDGPAFYLKDKETWEFQVGDDPIWVWSTQLPASVTIDEAVA